MKILAKLSVILLLSLWGSAQATSYVVDGEHSAVHFSTVKKQYIVEPAVFKKVSGKISDTGKAEVHIDLLSIDTRVPIRNERVNKLFFDSKRFPNAKVTAEISPSMLEKVENFKKMSIPATITLYGNSKKANLNVLIAKVENNRLLVTSLSPTVINAKDFGIPDGNLAKLASTVGGISISNKVGVSFVLSFTRAGD